VKLARVIAVLALVASGCGVLIGLDAPTFDANGSADGTTDGIANDGDDARGGGDDGPMGSDAQDGDAKDGGPDAPGDACSGTSLCLTYENDAEPAADIDIANGSVFIENARAHSPTHSLQAAVNTGMTHAIAKYDAGPFISGTKVSLFHSILVGPATGVMGLAEITFSTSTVSLRVWFTPTDIELEWWDSVAPGGNGKVTIQTRSAAPFSELSFVILGSGVHDGAGTSILGAPPKVIAGELGVNLGIVDNPQGAAGAVFYDDITVHTP
jgi:hypothetical protein